MDFRNLCQKIDVDSIRAKIPPMPAIPSLYMIKMPKSMPKLKSRKIFRSSRENASANANTNTNTKDSPKQQQRSQQTPPPIPPADFITHMPKRISTISSLVHEGAESQQYTYRSACSIDDDYPSPTKQRFHRRTSRPISPVRMPVESPNFTTPTARGGSTASVKMSLTEKLQKGYKDIAEFRLKHIFAKKTVVRRDNIEVDTYVQRYNEDRTLEILAQEQHDRSIADNYRFKFKVSRQNTGHTNSISSNESASSEKGSAQPKMPGKSVSEQSGDESGMEASPPKRKPGIAATRFAKMRDPPLSRTMSEESEASMRIASFEDDDDYVGMRPADVAVNSSTLWSIKQSRTLVDASPLVVDEEQKASTVKSIGYKERMRRFTSYVSSHDESGAESTPEGADTGGGGGGGILSKLRGLGKSEDSEQREKKRKAPLTPQQSEEREITKTVTGDNRLETIKQNIKRVRKSMKKPQQPTGEDSDEDECKDTKPGTKAQRLAARLRQFASREDLSVDAAKKEGNRSPIHAVIANKLQTWRKSFKRSQGEAETHSGNETSPEKQKRPDSILDKLKHIRSRKNPNSTEELNVDENEESVSTGKNRESTIRKTSNLEEKFEQARQRTMQKVNEKMQQMKFFHRSQDHVEKDKAKKSSGNETDDEDGATALNNDHKTISRRYINDTDEHSSDQEDIEKFHNMQPEYTKRTTCAAWTTKPILSDSMDESDDNDTQFPRVLIHQDNSDVFESTLIISVTRSASLSPTPKITEILPERETCTPTSPTPKPVEWVPNTQIISSFMEITPPSNRKMSSDSNAVGNHGHSRKHSVDSNSDSDTWIPEPVRNKQLTAITDNSRRTSIAGLNSIVENEEPWKVHSMFRDEKLYKTKSIDIFEATAKKGGASAAFEDFDDELKNEPVVRIVNTYVDSFEKDSSEDPDAADDDNSSRVTKILMTRTDCLNVHVESATPLKSKKGEEVKDFDSSRESLTTCQDSKDEMYFHDADNDDDRPPSTPPSPPPSFSPPPPPSLSPPPPPLPQRKHPIAVVKTAEPGPKSMPTEKPPPPPPQSPPPQLPLSQSMTTQPSQSQQPPKIPERTASMSRIARPLVKTSSLRLAYSEQVKPADVGKVNKLISRFEQPTSVAVPRPRYISRRVPRDDSEDFTDEDDDESDNANYDENNLSDVEDCDEECVKDCRNDRFKMDRDITPTPTNTPKATLLLKEPQISITAPQRTSAPIEKAIPSVTPIARDVENNIEILLQSPTNIPKISLSLDRTSNCSRQGSEYGSPLAYPSSLVGSAATTPTPDRRPHDLLHASRSRRSMTRDDDNFQSFDSDEENSYYSISSSGSSRYVVEI